MANFWVLKRVEPNQISGELETVRGGYLSMQSTSSGETISLPFIWGSRFTGVKPGWGIDPDENFDNLFKQLPTQAYWWQLRPRDETDSGNSNTGVVLDPTSVQNAPGSTPDLFLSLAYNDKLASAIKTASSINVISSDPVTDSNIFSRLFSSSYKVAAVTEVPLPIAGDNPAPAVPEPTSNLAAVVVGAIALGLAVKRKLSHTSSVSGRRE